jgi:TPR repeat protein
MPRDLALAAYYFGQAAEGGNGDAQLMLSRMYLLGEGVEIDFAKAFFWALLGAVQKPVLAEWYFDKLRGKLSVNQMDRIRAQSKAWHPKG